MKWSLGESLLWKAFVPAMPTDSDGNTSPCPLPAPLHPSSQTAFRKPPSEADAADRRLGGTTPPRASGAQHGEAHSPAVTGRLPREIMPLRFYSPGAKHAPVFS